MTAIPSTEPFIPAFCKPMAAFFVVLVAELVAIFATLIVSNLPNVNWLFLGMASLCVQWIGLGSAATLCLLRPYLANFSVPVQLVAIFIVTLVIAAVVAVVGFRFAPSAASAGWQVLQFLFLTAIVVGIGLRYFVLQYQHQQQQQSELTSRLEILQARIRPHFLFNTLNSIASMIGADAAKAETMTLDFADLLRDAIQQPALVPLSQELDLCKKYCALEQLRFGEKLVFVWQEHANTQTKLPNLLLQPLIENAIYHGIQGRVDGGTIVITALERDEHLSLTVQNPLPDADFQAQTGQQLALKNIEHRLDLLYASKATINLTATTDEYRVVVSLPLQHG